MPLIPTYMYTGHLYCSCTDSPRSAGPHWQAELWSCTCCVVRPYALPEPRIYHRYLPCGTV